MLTYDLTKKGGLPLYEYLYKCIRQDIINKKLVAGERLPSKRNLAQHLQVAVITVANAYDQLVTEGYVRAAEKKGYFVENIADYRLAQEKTPHQDERDQEEHKFFADFKANRISAKNFPAATWYKIMREALSFSSEDLLATVPYNGLLSLLKALAEYLYSSRGMEVTPSQIIVGAGTEYLYGRLMQMFDKGCSIAIEDPGYKKLAAISSSFGGEWHYIPIDEHGMVVSKLEESGAGVVHLSPSNHFPTGTVMPIKRRVELFEWVNRCKNRFIIEDDYDSEFRYSGHYIPPLFTQDTRGRVIYMNTFSKSLVPSLRISYMVLPEVLLQRYLDTMSFYSCTVSSFEQYTLARFISEGYFERHINRMKNYYREQRTLILTALKKSPLLERAQVEERNAGTHFLISVKTELDADEVRARGLEQELQLSLYEDYSHGKNPRGEGFCTLVINYAAIEREKIADVVERLTKVFA